MPTNHSMPRFNLLTARTAFLVLFLVTLFMPIAFAYADQIGGGSGGGSQTGGGSGGGSQLGGGSGGGQQVGGGSSGTGGLQNPLANTSDLPTFLTTILKFITTQIGPAIIILMLVYCGFLFVTAQGNAEKVSTARTALLWTVIGAIILLGATVIEGVITSTVNAL